MERNTQKISLAQLITALSDAVDLVSPILSNHHKQVAYITYKLAKVLSFPGIKISDLLMASLLHDIGALSMNERIELLDFEEKNPYYHTIGGYTLLKDLRILKRAAEIIKHHHLPWDEGKGRIYKNELIHPESNLIYLADRVSVSIKRNEEILNQTNRILERIKSQTTNRFNPLYVEALEELSTVEAFWLDLISPSLDLKLKKIWQEYDLLLSFEKLMDVTKVFARIIDFRSRFTSVHTSGVAAVAKAIAQKMNWPKESTTKLSIAANLHDLGKLAIPNSILGKPAKLTDEEYNIMKTHTYYSYQLMSTVEGLETINEYGSFHHERIDGKGYPFKIKGSDLKEGSRIIAVADVLTAITEDRPYREGMNHDQAMTIIARMGQNAKLDSEIAALVIDNFEEINLERMASQRQAARKYQAFENEMSKVRSYYCYSKCDTKPKQESIPT